MTGLRLMPVVMTAACALLALKLVGVVTHAGDLFATPAVAAGAAKAADPKPETKPEAHGGEQAKAAVAGEKPALPEDHGSKEGAARKAPPKEKPPVDSSGQLAVEPPSEQALLEALSKRRAAMAEREAGLDQREALLKAAEKRMEDRLAELKRMEGVIADADRRRAEEEAGKLKELVTLYENMKPKEAARIFDKLEPQVLLDVAVRMKPRALSVVMGLMAPDQAQKLTVALARREVAPPPQAFADAELPKIEGKPARR